MSPVDADLNPQVMVRVREAIDMLELVGEHVRLRRRGRTWEGLCPFHDEKTPSFSVDPEKGLFYCFGCHEGGDAISFVMKVEHLPFPDAVERIARRFGVPLPARSPESRRRAEEHDRLRSILEEAQHWFGEQLLTPQGAVARLSLERRGFDRSTWSEFGFGYAPDDWRQLLQHLATRHTEQSIVTAGLAISPEGDKPPYDRFRHRVTFPIRAGDGRLVAFGGRILGDREPKYLNSPEGALFHKRSTLFLLDRARRAMARSDEVIVVEGYFDCLSLHRVGIEHTVATLGTALTTDHAHILRRLASRVLLCYDADAPGRRAAYKGARVLLEAGLEVATLVLPPGQDPDDVVRVDDGATMQQLIASPTTVLDFLLDGLPEDRDLRRRAGARLAELVGAARDPLARFNLLDELARRLDLRFDVLEEVARRAGGRQQPPPTHAQPSSLASGERLLVRILLEGGSRWRRRIVDTVEPSLRQDPRVRLLLERASEFERSTDAGQSFDHWLAAQHRDEELERLLAEVSAAESPPLTDDMIHRQLSLLLRRQWREQASRLNADIRSAEQAGDTERVSELQRQQHELRSRTPDPGMRTHHGR